jgi:two-component system, response regulator PdtaR
MNGASVESPERAGLHFGRRRRRPHSPRDRGRMRAQGFLVVEAATADQALSYLQAGVQVDLVFSDIEMPGSMNGVGLIQRLRVAAPNLPTVLTSGASPEAHEADAFVSKPYDIKQVIALITRLLNKETG